MGSKYHYFKAAGRSLEIVRDFQKQMQERHDEILALAKEVGADRVITRHAVAGFIFKGDVPEGWVSQGYVEGSKVKFYAPQKRKKVDKSFWDRMRALKVLGTRDFGDALGADMFGFVTNERGARGGMIIRHPSFEAFGDTVVIIVPVAQKNDFTPPDAEPLKASEYWALKEAEETA